MAIAEGRVRMAAPTLTAILAGDAKQGRRCRRRAVRGHPLGGKMPVFCHPRRPDQGLVHITIAGLHRARRGAMHGSGRASRWRR